MHSSYVFVSCHRCGALSETILHLWGDYPKAIQVSHLLKFDTILRYDSKCIQPVSITHSFLLDVGLFESLEMTKLSLTLITTFGLFLDKFTLIPPRRFFALVFPFDNKKKDSIVF